jgi:hypothetical protein
MEWDMACYWCTYTRFFALGDSILFFANDLAHGVEPWIMRPKAD